MARIGAKLKQILEEEFSSFLSSVALSAQNVILKNFDDQKDVDGDPFAELEKYTQNERRRLGYGATSPILKRTKKLRNSIKVIPLFKSKTFIIDSVEYGDYLHDGIESKSGIKKWKILDLPKDLSPGGSKREDIFEKFAGKLEERILKQI